jgi:glycosyltransferase involved in cell wall biosynthesis
MTHATRQRHPHVVFVLGGLSMGGAEGQLTSLLETAVPAQRRWRVTVLTLGGARDRSLERRLEAVPELEIVEIDRSAHRFLGFLVALRRWFAQRRPDVVHTLLSGTAGTWGRLMARAARVPIVMHSDRSLEPRRTVWQRRLEPLANRWTDRVLTNAESVAARLRRSGVPAERIAVVRNGVDLDRFAAADGAALRTSWEVPSEDAMVVGYLGMLRPEKRPGLLLDAALSVAERERPDLIAVAGDGPLRPELQARVEGDAWLRRHVRLLGTVEDAPGFLAAIDVLALCSDTEGLPNAVIEAMAAGRPCVATRVSDVPELVGEDGLLVPRGDAAELGEALAEMRRLGPSARREMGARARERARARFALDVAAERFWAEHDGLVPSEPGRAP